MMNAATMTTATATKTESRIGKTNIVIRREDDVLKIKTHKDLWKILRHFKETDRWETAVNPTLVRIYHTPDNLGDMMAAMPSLRKTYLKNLQVATDISAVDSVDSMKEYLGSLSENPDEIGKLIGAAIADTPEVKEKYMKNVQVSFKGYQVDIPDIRDNDQTEICLRANGFFTAFPENGRYRRTLPMRNNAYQSLIGRVGDDGPVMTRMNSNARAAALPDTKKAERLNEDCQLYTPVQHQDGTAGGWKIHVRDGFVDFFGSENYRIVPEWEVFKAFEEFAEKNFGDISFDAGKLGANLIIGDYLINDEETVDTLQLQLESAGHKTDEVKIGFRVASSDQGLGAIRLRCFVDLDGIRFELGGGVALEHKGETSLALLKDEMDKKCAKSFTDMGEMIEQLGSIDLVNTEEVIREVVRAYRIFSTKNLGSVIKSFKERHPDGKGTAIDVVIALTEIVELKNSLDAMSPADYVNAKETIARLASALPYAAIDAGQKWVKP